MKNNNILGEASVLLGDAQWAKIQAPGGHKPLMQHGTTFRLRSGRMVLAVMGVLLASVCLPPSVSAVIEYTAGTETVGPQGIVSVPITVSVTPDLAGEKWVNAGFDLTWVSSVLALQSTMPISVDFSVSPLPLAAGDFSNPGVGELDFHWFDNTFTGSAVPNGSILFTVSFVATGSAGSSTTIGVASTPDSILFSDFTSTAPSFNPGSVTVVPEPINWALGLFACAFVGTAIIRWIARRGTLQPPFRGD